MRVLLIAPQAWYIDRGTPIDVDIMLRALSNRGDEVDLVCYPYGEDRVYEHVTVHRGLGPRSFLPRPGFSVGKLVLDALLVPKVLRLAFTRRYDVVHAGEEAVFLALLLKWLRGFPFVYDMDSSIAQQMVEQMSFLKALAPVFNAMEAFVIRRAVAAAPVCHALAELAEERGAAHVVTLHDISQLSQPLPEPAGLLAEEWGIERPAILYVGNFQPYQGVDLLIDAFAAAVEQGAESDLVIAGGTQRGIDKYRKKAEALGVADRTHLIGHWPNDRLGELLTEASIIVSPRIRGINTPMKVFPYLHSGVPVLVTEIPTHTQILDSRVAALAPPDPASMAAEMIRLERDPELRERLGRAGREFVEANHTFESHLGRVNALYDHVLEALPRREPAR
jgi:glycosyltransferase involved in cell wall biosynthesis